MSTQEATGESMINENTLEDELIFRMNELESKYKSQFDHIPLHKPLNDIVRMESNDEQLDPLKLCAIFTDFADAFLDKAFDCTQTMEQNNNLSKELYKANDLIRRLTEENEYYLKKYKYLTSQLEIYKDSWRGKLTEQSVERQISDLLKNKDEEVQSLKGKLSNTEQEFAQYRFDTKTNTHGTPSKKYISEGNESKHFSELKGNDPSKYKIPKTMNFEQQYEELMNTDHRELVDL